MSSIGSNRRPTDPPVGLHAMTSAMVAIVAEAAAVNIRDFEELEAGPLDTTLEPTTVRLLTAAIGLLGRILDLCEREQSAASADATDGDLRQLERTLERSSGAGTFTDVEELTFVAQLELRQRLVRLQHAGRTTELVHRLSELDSALRRIRRALGAVESAIARLEGVRPQIDVKSALRTSLEVRRALAKFGRFVADAGEPTEHEVRAHLRRLGTHIATVIGWDVYTDLRVQDRLMLRRLQDRILAWMRAEGPDAAAGVRIWRDLVSCAEMFRQVRQRQELREHDQAELAALAPALAAVPADEPLDLASWQRLQTLVGLDPVSDRLLLRREPVSGAVARDLLRRIATSARLTTGDEGP